MSLTSRYLSSQVKKDLQKKMVFLGGPRQVGKTTLSLNISSKAAYFNWDAAEHREQILKRELPANELWIFDEIHKYKSWRNYLKGLYDIHKSKHKILVTGSARLDYYRRGGDSLQGRYHYLRLHPLSVAELKINRQNNFLDLLKLGGFPEPYFEQSEIESQRWSREYRERLIYDDLNSLENIQDLGNLELLLLRLPHLVGSPLSINALREDLQVSHKAVTNWLNILERLYALFRISPFSKSHLRAVKKEQKHYHFDWTLLKNEGARFENMVACHLLKWVHYQVDCFGEDYQLHYFRDVDGKEIDFIVTKNSVPVQAIECKWNDDSINPALIYFKKKYPTLEAFQLSCIGKKDFISAENIRVMPALEWLRNLI